MSNKEIGIKAVIKPDFDFSEISKKIRQGLPVSSEAEQHLKWKRFVDKYSFQLPEGSPAFKSLQNLRTGRRITETEFNSILRAFKDIQEESLSIESKENARNIKEQNKLNQKQIKLQQKEDEKSKKSQQKINDKFLLGLAKAFGFGKLSLAGLAIGLGKKAYAYGSSIAKQATALGVSGEEFSSAEGLLAQGGIKQETASKIISFQEEQSRLWKTRGIGFEDLMRYPELDRDMIANLSPENRIKYFLSYLYKNKDWSRFQKQEFVKSTFGSLDAGIMDLAELSPEQIDKLTYQKTSETARKRYREVDKFLVSNIRGLETFTSELLLNPDGKILELATETLDLSEKTGMAWSSATKAVGNALSKEIEDFKSYKDIKSGIGVGDLKNYFSDRTYQGLMRYPELDRDMIANLSPENRTKYFLSYLYKNKDWSMFQKQEFVKSTFGSLDAGIMDLAKMSPEKIDKLKYKTTTEEAKEKYRALRMDATSTMQEATDLTSELFVKPIGTTLDLSEKTVKSYSSSIKSVGNALNKEIEDLKSYNALNKEIEDFKSYKDIKSSIGVEDLKNYFSDRTYQGFETTTPLSPQITINQTITANGSDTRDIRDAVEEGTKNGITQGLETRGGAVIQ